MGISLGSSYLEFSEASGLVCLFPSLGMEVFSHYLNNFSDPFSILFLRMFFSSQLYFGESHCLGLQLTDVFCSVWFLIPLVYYSVRYCILQMCDFCFALSYVYSLLKFSLCSFISLPTAVSLFMTMALDSLSYRSLTFLLLMSFSEVLSHSFVWNMFLSFLILLNSLHVSIYQAKELLISVLNERLCVVNESSLSTLP